MLRKNKKCKVRSVTQLGLIAASVVFFVFFAFAGEAKAATYQCNNCGDCRNKISSAADGDTVELAKDIWDTTDLETAGTIGIKSCIIFNNKQNIIFDCRDYVIDGTGQYIGIYFSDGSNGNTIKNCYITGFLYGIYFYGEDSTTNSSFNNLSYITVNNNNNFGVYSRYSKSNGLNNITANNNGGYGIYFQSSSSNTLNIITTSSNGNYGIYFSGASSGNNLSNITANNNGSYGIYAENFGLGSLTNTTVNGNKSVGIVLGGCNSNALTNITAVNNSTIGWNNYGIQFYDSDSNTILDSVIKWDGDEVGDKDISVDANSSGNTFYNNQFISKDKIKDDGLGTVWDKTGSGNLWEVFDQDSENCFDADSDGYCDNNGSPATALIYAIDANSIDNHPKRVTAVSAHYCNSCADCNSKIASAKSGDTVYLTKDILNFAGNCINLQNKTNLIFDCQGYTINKDAITAGNGVYLDNGGANGLNTVKNCVIINFTIGVYALNSNQNTVSGNTVKTNTADIKLTVALNNVFYDNEFFSQGKTTDEAANFTAWDNGAAGNHWEGFDQTSEGCLDTAPTDGYCDGGYTIISSGAKDDYAEYTGNSCETCEDCSAKIAAASPGDTIKLAKSIVNAGATCVKFNNKQNITFDCQGYGIDGTGARGSYGVYILGVGGNDNNTVKNCHITAFAICGVYASNSNANTFDNVAANYNTNHGFLFFQSSSNIFKNNITANYNTAGYGLSFTNSNSNILTDPAIVITANNNSRGIYFDNSSSNELINLTANNNSGYGIYFSISGNNTIKDSMGIKFNPVNINIVSDNGINGNKFYNNDFISKNKIIDLSPRTEWDDGAVGGNWWQSYDSGDEGCVDGSGDSICDAAYTVGSLGNKDNFPEWKKLTDDEYHCTDCASCTGAIANALYGDKIILDNHIFGGSHDCVNFGGYKEGLTFKSGCAAGDCIIQGPGEYYSGQGIYFSGYNEDNTIKNIIISNFDRGINLADKGNKFNVFSDIMLSYNSYGISVYKWQTNCSESSIFTRIMANNNSRGISIHYSTNNILTYNSLFNNDGYGVEFWGGGGNHTVASSTLKLNAIDVNISSANNNLFYNNQFTSKSKISDNTATTIWDNGVKGNWWEAYDSDGDGCYDDGLNGGSNPVANDGYCDNRYEVKTGIYDRYPQYKGGTGVVYTCSTCSECNSKIIQAKYGDTIQLTQDIFGAVDTCVELEYKQGITFDCQNHNISGQDGNNGYGVYVKGRYQNDYNTVKKCILSKFNSGVVIFESSANTLDNITANSNSNYGVVINWSNFDNLINITARNHAYYGIYLFNSGNNKLSQITADNNGTGIYFKQDSSSNSVTDSAGIKLNKTNIETDAWSFGNIFYNNQFTSKTKINDSNTGIGNNITHWNKWDNVGGDQKPGNQWEDYDTFAEGCSDIAAADGYCDAAPYWKDKFPKYYGVTTNRTCNTCGTCNTEIANALYGEKITLAQNITGVSGDCVKLNYKEGITFNCDNHKIVGTNVNSKGIYLLGLSAEYNTIEKCDISSFGYGIYIKRSSNNTLKNIVSNYNKYYIPGTGYNGMGIYLSSANSNILENITSNYNYYAGIWLNVANSNNLTSVNLNNNTNKGLYFSQSDNNTASSSNIKSNAIDVYIDSSSSDNNKFYNNELTTKDKIFDLGTGTKWDNGVADGGNHWESFDAVGDCYLDGVVEKCCTGAGAYCGNPYKIDDKTASGDGGVSIDNYPKTGAAPQIYTCADCADCNAKIAGSTAADTIKLTEDIIGHSGTCINFGNKSGITFNCQDYIISGSNKVSSYGINVTGSYNTVKNCNVSNFYYGIYVYDSPSNNLTNNNASYNSQAGVYVDCANHVVSGNNLSNITANYNGNYGILLQGAGVGSRFAYGALDKITASYNNIGISGVLKDSVIKNSVITNNKNYGLEIATADIWFPSDNNVIFANVIKWNTDGTGTGKDIIINSSYTSNQTFYGNDLTNKNMITDSGTNTKWDNGLAVGGNHWDGYDSADENCKDVAPINGYCDNAYAIDGNSIDNYPKYIGGVTTFYCNSCADCNSKIATSTNGSTINLANNISNQAGNCLNLSGKQNIIFNCQEYTIDGDGGGAGNAVYLANSGGNGNNTVKNCVISDFNNGIYIVGSDGNIVASSTIKTNITKDAVIDAASDNNIFYSNEFLNEGKMADGGTNTHWNSWSGAVNQAPGNHWQGYDESTETCKDIAPADGYCDAAYTITSSGAVDNYAKYIGAENQYECNSCADCNAKIAGVASGDTIKLTKNILNQAGGCVEIANSNIIFDCQGYGIDGDNAGNESKGIYLLNPGAGNRIKNCAISGFYYGVYFENSGSNYLENTQANNNKYSNSEGYGIYLKNSKSNNFTAVTANNNYHYGIYFDSNNTKWNSLVDVFANYNGIDGIKFASSPDNYLTNVTAKNNTENGINFENSNNNTATSSEFKWNKINIKLNNGSNGNVFYDNKLISKEKIDDQGVGTVWDNGANLGNWWEAFDWADEGCFDINSNNFCDDGVNPANKPYWKDNHPKYKGPLSNQTYSCSSCADCSNKIQNARYGETVKLDQDINTINKDCVDFSRYKEGVTLDCQNLYYISGTGGSGDKGVYIHGNGKENNTVKNCSVLGFDYGVYADASDVVNIKNTVAFNSRVYGIYINQSNDNILDNIKADYNGYYGVFISQSFNNTLTDISASNNSLRGLNLYSNGNNTLYGANEFKNNNEYGIWIGCYAGPGAVNTIADSIVKQNKKNIYIGPDCNLASGVVNLFYDNEFISKEKMEDLGATTKWDNGSKGNWWEAFDWADEGCYDDGLANGFCDDGIAAGDIAYWKDNHPKYKGPPSNQTYSCSSCADCNNKIQNARYGETVGLNQNIYSEADCINFGNYKEGVTFDCDKGGGEKYSITGNADYTGVYIKGDGVENHTVKNCQLRNFKAGIKIDGSDGNKINNIAANNLGIGDSRGVWLIDADSNRITNSNLDYNNYGIFFTRSNQNTIDNISAQYGYKTSDCNTNSWGYGISFYNWGTGNPDTSNNNTIINSTVKYHYINIHVRDNTSQNNKFYNNHFVSKEKITDNGTGTQWDNGTDAGNWWEACIDGDHNGICDSAYIIDANSKDNYPKYEGGNGITTCVSCDDCNAKIAQSKYGETVRLIKDIFLYSGSCIKFNYKEGVIFDGNGCATGDCIINGICAEGGCSFYGIDSGNGINVCGAGAENNKIKNFGFITNFVNGIYIEKSASNTLENITASNNQTGIYLNLSNGNYLIENIKTNNNMAGVYLSQSNSNFLNEIIANNNIAWGCGWDGAGGICFSSSNSNILTNITANNNLNGYCGGGIYFKSSNSNILNNITANNNSLVEAFGSIDQGGGIYFSSSNSNILTNITAKNNTMDSAGIGGGLSFNTSSNNQISFATLTGNYKDGIYFSGSNTNTIASSTIQNNSNKDINISSGSGNIFHANEFNSKSNMTDNGVSTHWNWRVGGANAKPGNHWSAYDSFADGCYDDGAHGGLPAPIAYDGYCDNHYNIKTAVYDEYPIRLSVMPADFSITSAYAGSLIADGSTCKNVIMWQNNSDADEYIIFRSVNGGAYANIASAAYDKNYYVDGGVDNAKEYNYYVEARNGIFKKLADCDRVNSEGIADKLHCKEDDGTETAKLYPTICPAVLSVSGVCSAVDLSWPDVTPTDSYNVLRSIDDETSYQYACVAGDPPFVNPCPASVESIVDTDANLHPPNATNYTYQDTDASLNQDYYKIQNCIGACPSVSKCQPTAVGPRDGCYVESSAKLINPCNAFAMPTWKEVRP